MCRAVFVPFLLTPPFPITSVLAPTLAYKCCFLVGLLHYVALAPDLLLLTPFYVSTLLSPLYLYRLSVYRKNHQHIAGGLRV